MAHGQSGAADVSRLAERDGEVVLAELVEHPKGGADLADTFIVAAEGGEADLDVTDPRAGVLGGKIEAEAAQSGWWRP